MKFLLLLSFFFGQSAFCRNSDLDDACQGRKSCFMALNGVERNLCEAYKEKKSCFMALDGDDRGWCEAIKDKKSCFMALNGSERERCEEGSYPGTHVFWARCGNVSLPDAPHSSPRMRACKGETSCFMALDGTERGLCEAYKEKKSCFMALDGDDRGWCEVMKEGKSCFMALNGNARNRCEEGRFPGDHIFWQSCGNR